MSEFLSVCPKCRQRILCDTQYAGQRVACPLCLQEIVMPSPPAAALPAAGAQPASGGRRVPLSVALTGAVLLVLAAVAGVWLVGKKAPAPAPPVAGSAPAAPVAAPVAPPAMAPAEPVAMEPVAAKPAAAKHVKTPKPSPAAMAPAVTHKTKIVLVGDTTVMENSGWGPGFKEFLTDQVVCINTAVGARSSLTFMQEGRWTNALALQGNYYLIQFGHSNEPGKPGRSTDMPTFIANMQQYVEDTRAIGAQPVLVTPLARRQWDKDGQKILSSLEPYAAAVRQIAAAKNVPLVDLHARSVEVYESLGRQGCYDLCPIKSVDGDKTNYDGTSLNARGSAVFARIIVQELCKALPAATPLFKPDPRGGQSVQETKYDALVADDGSGAYTNLQAAIDAAPGNATKPYVILIKPGTYAGQFVVAKEKRHLVLLGEEAATTVLTGAARDNEADARTAYNHASTVVLADDFRAENLTFENTADPNAGQALALRVDGDREVFNRCRVLGWQAVLLLNNGRDYLTNCYVEGHTYFIYGSATALFDQCEIHSKNGGHITAASTPQDHPFGLVFRHCQLTGDGPADLGGPWKPYAAVAYLNCEMAGHIRPEGWNNWRNAGNETTARFAEYQSTGSGASPDARLSWTHQLTDDEVQKYTMENILGRADHWLPGYN